MTKQQYRWTLEEVDGDKPPVIVVQVLGDMGVITSMTSGLKGYIADLATQQLAAAGFGPPNGGGRRRGRPAGSKSAPSVEPSTPPTPELATSAPIVNPFQK